MTRKVLANIKKVILILLLVFAHNINCQSSHCSDSIKLNGKFMFDSFKTQSQLTDYLSSKQYQRDLVRVNRDADFGLSNQAVLENINRFSFKDISRRNNNPCIINDTFSFVAPRIKRNMGFGVIKTLTYDSSKGRLWAGAYPGGLFYSDDLGNNWNSLANKLPFYNINSINISPFDSKIIQINNYISYDGGNNWTQLELKTNNGDSIINIHCAMFSSDTFGKAFVNCQIYNLQTNRAKYVTFISRDNLKNLNNLGDYYFADMKTSPKNNLVLYGASNFGGIYKSINGGNSWSKLSLNTSFTTLIATSKAEPSSLFALNYGISPARVYKSDDAGNTWRTLNSTDIYVGQTLWNNAFSVSDNDASKIFVGTISLYISNNGGANFYRQSSSDFCGMAKRENRGIHADHHSFINIPNTDTLAMGNDGGIYLHEISSDTLMQTVQTPQCGSFGPRMVGEYHNKTMGLQIGEVYGLSLSEQKNNYGLAALWHNGTSYIKKDTLLGLSGGDGFDCWFAQNDDNIHYASSQAGVITRYTVSPKTNKIISRRRGKFHTKYKIDPFNSDIIYMYSASEGLIKSNNQGATWETSYSAASITDFEIHPKSSENLYLALPNQSQFYYSRDSGKKWIITPPAIVNKIRYIKPSSKNPKIVYVANNSDNEPLNRVAIVNLSQPFQDKNITYNLPMVNIYDMQLDSNNGVYIASRGAVYYLKEKETKWVELGGNLPNIPINLMRINYKSSKIVIGTDGRGVWETILPTLELNISLDTFILCPKDSLYIVNNWYSKVGNFTDTLKDKNGCDSLMYQFAIIDGRDLPKCQKSNSLSTNKPYVLKLYPNPTNGQFIIETNKTLSASIYSVHGKIIQGNIKLNKGENMILLKQHSLGTYFIILSDSTGFTKTCKIILVE